MNLVMIGGFIANGWMTICTSLSYLVYNLVELLYRVFASISNVNLFSKSVFDKFTARMYSVVAILMLFILAYNLILMIINPDDKKGTGQTTKFVKEVVISLILIILLPLVFNYMAIFQKHILDSQIITKIVLGGSTGDANSDCDFSKYTSLDKLDSENISTATLKSKCEKYNGLTPSVQGAYIMNATMVGSFLYPINYNFNKCEDFIIKCDGTDLKNCDKDSKISDKKDRELCGKYFYNYKMTQYDGGIWHLLNNSYFKNMVKDEDQKILNFNYFLALVGGILALIMFASYTIMIGIRVAKLGFLELISPIPVMMRMIPKQKEAFFDKWLKELKNTYLDVFIRLIIINFALFSISLVPDVIEQLSASGDDSLAVVLLAKFVVILGILQFAKETPDLIKEFFGGSGRFSIKKGFSKWQDSAHQMGGAAGAVGALGYMTARSVKNVATAEKGNKLKTFGKEALNVTKTAGVLKAGYKAGSTSGVSDFISNVGDAEHSVRYKRSTVGNIADNIDLAKSKRLGAVSKKYSDLEKILDGKTPIQSLTTTFEEQKKEAAKKTYGSLILNGTSYNMSDISQKQEYLNALDKQFKTERNKLRMVELQKGIKENDKEIKDNYGIYLDALKENKSEINAMLKEYDPNSPGLNLDKLDMNNIITEPPTADLFNNQIRTPGSNAGKESNSIGRRVQERKDKSSGNK